VHTCFPEDSEYELPPDFTDSRISCNLVKSEATVPAGRTSLFTRRTGIAAVDYDHLAGRTGDGKVTTKGKIPMKY
jgi:hypothetical protein